MTGMQMAAIASGEGPKVTLSNLSCSDLQFSPTAATALLSLNNNKSVTASALLPPDWLNAAGAVANYEARATVLSGTLSSGTTGAWLNLATSRSWTLTKGGGSAGIVNASFTLEIRDATTLAVLATATIDLSAEVS